MKWQQPICELQLGAGSQEGGSRSVVLRAGGETGLPFLFKEGSMPHKPLIAAEVTDAPEEDLPETLRQDLKGLLEDPVLWSKKMLEVGADLICLKLSGIHPDGRARSVDESLTLVKGLLSAVGCPLIILGCGHSQKDNEVLPAVSEAARGEKILFGDALQENYKTLTAACIADGHSVIAESPIDVNIAKQLNILISDLGMPLDRIAINPTIGALGYGLEYAYSIMERARNAALSGDKMLAMPFVCFVGQETWRTKESKVPQKDCPTWGDARQRGILWEVVTAMAMLQAGADILTLRHPESIRMVKSEIAELMKRGA
ncbi:MAG: acetyl-CoA decarbonylase/synthase complex subunit delta [Candidatus Omnitrophota bacterium]